MATIYMVANHNVIEAEHHTTLTCQERIRVPSKRVHNVVAVIWASKNVSVPHLPVHTRIRPAEKYHSRYWKLKKGNGRMEDSRIRASIRCRVRHSLTLGRGGMFWQVPGLVVVALEGKRKDGVGCWRVTRPCCSSGRDFGLGGDHWMG